MHSSAAFTLVELLISVAVAGLLIGIAAAGMAPARSAYAVRSARSAFGTLVAHARAQAVERGSPVYFEVDPVGDSAWIRSDTTTLEKVRFREELNVDLSGTRATVCMTPRGIADLSCGSVSGAVDVTFGRSGRSVSATILAYGQFLARDQPASP